MSDDKKMKAQALESTLKKIKKQFGEGSVMKFDDENSKVKVDFFKTGLLAFDDAIGIGGVPKGRIIEFYGNESSGKTTLAITVAQSIQKQGGVVAIIDAEHALDPGYAEKLGLNLQDVIIAQPNSGEEALSITEELVRSGAVDCIVIDSVAALTPQKELEGEMGDANVGLQARLMSQALRKLTAFCSKMGCIVIFINQIRMKIGVMYGNPETTTGGNALKFYSSLRVEVKRGTTISEGDSQIGFLMRFSVVKNKVAPPFKKIEIPFYYSKGFCAMTQIIDMAEKLNVVEKAGSWYSFEGNKLSQGKENLKKVLEEDKALYDKVEALVREKMSE
jgi:recombination protein RecA